MHYNFCFFRRFLIIALLVPRYFCVYANCAAIPTFEEQPQNVSLYAGQTAFFPCSVSQDRAHRSPRVTWLRNGAPLRLDPLKMVQLPSGALEIDALVAHDEGQYQCQVTTGDKVCVYRFSSILLLMYNICIEMLQCTDNR